MAYQAAGVAGLAQVTERHGGSRTGLCGAKIELGPVSGVARCELEVGHTSTWHRSDDAGWEWSTGQLWPLLPGDAA